jgi:hypothetical protein
MGNLGPMTFYTMMNNFRRQGIDENLAQQKEKIAQQNADTALESTRRNNPYPEETSSRLNKLSPDSLDTLLNFEGKKTPAEIEATLANILSQIGTRKANVQNDITELGIKGREADTRAGVLANKERSDAAVREGRNLPTSRMGGEQDELYYNSLPPEAQAELQQKPGESPEDYNSRLDTMVNNISRQPNSAATEHALGAIRHFRKVNAPKGGGIWDYLKNFVMPEG